MRRRVDPLVQAARERIIRELRGEAARQAVINNYVGHPAASRGVAEQLGGVDPGDFDYKVKITRDALRDAKGNVIYDDNGKPVGWNKDVHRFREPKRSPEDAGPGGRVGSVHFKKKVAMGQ